MPVAISIVMPVLNRAGYVSRALESVFSQGVDELEVIAVDGGSTDGTQAILERAEGARLVRAPGSSIYEALNIGIGLAEGALIGHLNSDDRLPVGALWAVLSAAKAAPAADIICGRARFVERGPDGAMRALSTLDDRVRDGLDIRSVTFGTPAINRCFTRAGAYRTLGPYDESLRIAADREWLLRAVCAHLTVHAIEDMLYEYLVHEGSATIGANGRSEAEYAREHLAIAARYLARPLDSEARRVLLSWHAQEMIRYLMRARTGLGVAAEAARAFKHSPMWPLRSIPPLLAFSARRLGMSGGSPGLHFPSARVRRS